MERKTRLVGVKIVVWATLAFWAPSSFLYAQEGTSARPSNDGSTKYSKQARTTPVSDSRITLRLTFGPGLWAEVTQFEGATIRVEKDGSAIGLSPYLTDDGVKIKAFKIFSVKDHSKILGEGMSEFTDFEISRGGLGVPRPDLGATIELLNIQQQRTPRDLVNEQSIRLFDGDPPPAGGGDFGPGICCVTCHGVTVCGCTVTMPCGSCCVGSCC